MGVYDNIIFRCPSCSSQIVTQSKSGNCTLSDYQSTEVPVSVAHDANRHAPFKCDCGKSWYFDTPEIILVNLPIKESQ